MSKLNLNAIYLSKGMINVPQVTIGNDPAKSMEAVLTSEKMSSKEFNVAMSISIELMRFGKCLSPEALYGITLLNPADQLKLAFDLSNYLKDLYCDGEYETLFGDFPNTVLNMTELEMLLHQIVHYWATALGGEYWPARASEHNAEKKDSGMSVLDCCKKDSYTMITAGTPDDLAEVVKTLVSSQQSLTEWDKNVVYTVYNDIDTIPFSPMAKLGLKNVDVPFKETLCIIMAACPDAACIKDINDVLRVAVYLSGGDISLAPIPKFKDLGRRKVKLTKEDKKPWNFKNFNNKETRMLLSNIDAIVKAKGQDVVADMKKYAMRWIRLGEKLHPASADNFKKYPSAHWAFNIIRNSIEKVKTFGSSLEAAKEKRDLKEVLSLLSSRPGEFARQIDWLIRTFVQADANSNMSVDNWVAVETAFVNVLPKLSTKLLYELIDHFNARWQGDTERTVMIKGARKPVELSTLSQMSQETAITIIGFAVKELSKRMGAHESLTDVNVILDEDLQDIMLPKNMRSVNEGVKQLARGTKLHLPETSELLRFYLFWTDENATEDLDLHVRFYNEECEQKAYISWDGDYKLFNYDHEQYAQFSGDVRHRRGNCAEYIDVSITRALKAGMRYLVCDARDFNASSFKTGYCGLMAREHWGTPGETTWEPITVENGFKITSTTQSVILAIIDLKERKMIYVDEDMPGNPYSTYSTDSWESKLLKRYVDSKAFFNALSLIEMYYISCGAETSAMSHHAFELTKATVEGEIKTLTDCLAEPSMSEPHNAELKKTIQEKLEKAKSYKFVGFDEISVDYNKLLKYMF